MAADYFQSMAGIRLVHVLYGGSAPHFPICWPAILMLRSRRWLALQH
ncbi:hypothetical protein KB879_36825 (plasmid) [Cupriavidus sp. KK10]|nr:hypothetical protein KB879_36825 [Cupriavidus sp. KK10]